MKYTTSMNILHYDRVRKYNITDNETSTPEYIGNENPHWMN